ncbi:MAG TPA: transposase [Phycisphaerae bacterium]|nr:transposase [Phycisphaerae bacterium]
MRQGKLVRKTCKRYNAPWDAHALTFSCFRQKAFLSRDRTREYLAQAIAAAKQTHGFHVWAYVIMPEHVHLLLLPAAETYSISNILRSLKQPVGRKAIGYLRRENPAGLAVMATGQKHAPYRFWQDGGGYDRNIRSRDELVSMFEYIHLNPVRRGLVKSPDQWPWSSARAWRGLGEGLIPIDKDSYLRAAM